MTKKNREPKKEAAVNIWREVEREAWEPKPEEETQRELSLNCARQRRCGILREDDNPLFVALITGFCVRHGICVLRR